MEFRPSDNLRPSTRCTENNAKLFKISNDFNNDTSIREQDTFLPTGTKRAFGKSKRRLIFLLLFSINILANLDHGAIPAGTTKLMSELQLDHMTLGIIGSMVFLGLTIGASSAGFLLSNYSPKWIVLTSLICSSVFLYMFVHVTSGFVLGLCRVGCGFFQVTIK